MTTKKASKKKTTKKAASKSQQKRLEAQTGEPVELETTGPTAEELLEAGMKGEETVRYELDRLESGGKTYQVDLMAHSPEFQKFEIAKRIAHTLANSNLVPDAYRGRPNDCFVAINMGAELGMEPFQAIQSIAVIDGKPCLYGDGLIGVVRASSKCEWIEESISSDGKTATCSTQRKGDRNPVERSYSMTDAMLAGIDSKPNWRKHPKRMLQMRARAYCLRDAYPDLLKGLGMVEELVDHENTPPPVVHYELPKSEQTIAEAAAEAAGNNPLLDQAREVFGDGVQEVTLKGVEHAMMQSETMADLLNAAKTAKFLSEEDQVQARITYKKMRAALQEDASNVT